MKINLSGILWSGEVKKRLLIVIPVVLIVAFAGIFLPAREVSVEPFGMLSLESKITITIGYEVAYAAPLYRSPTGFEDPGSQWLDETNAYTNTGTYAYTDIAGASTWSDYLILNHDPAIACDRIRYYFEQESTHVNSCQIDVYYNNQWNNILNAEPTWGVSTEVLIGSTQPVTSARMMFINTHGSQPRMAYVHEFEFYEFENISNLPTSINFLTVNTGTDYWAYGGTTAPGFPLGDGECFFEVTNSSSAAVDIAIKATDFTGGTPGWTLTSGTPGTDTVRLKAGASGTTADENAMFILTTSDQLNFISSLLGLPDAPNNTKKWELKMETPESFSNADEKTATITLTATFS